MKFKAINFILLSILLVTNQAVKVSRLNSGDLCRVSTQTECKGAYDSLHQYQVKCETKCRGKYAHACGKNLCSVNKISCNEYQRVANTLNAYYKFVFLQHVNELNAFKAFNSAIVLCPQERRQWKANDICYNKLECHNRKQFIIINNRTAMLKKKSIYPCKGMPIDDDCIFFYFI